eukprot:Sro1805_g298750.2  (255) ;mRNA; f:3611-4375
MGNELSSWRECLSEWWEGGKEEEAEKPPKDLRPPLSEEEKQRLMEELKGLAAECGFEHVHQADIAIGGFLHVLQKSEHMDGDTVAYIVDSIQGADDAIKQYVEVAVVQKLTKKFLNPLRLVKLTKALLKVYKAQRFIKRLKRPDKDCMHTEDVVRVLQKVRVPQEAIELFLGGFIAFLGMNFNVQVGDILCLAEEQEEGAGDDTDTKEGLGIEDVTDEATEEDGGMEEEEAKDNEKDADLVPGKATTEMTEGRDQ